LNKSKLNIQKKSEAKFLTILVVLLSGWVYSHAVQANSAPSSHNYKAESEELTKRSRGYLEKILEISKNANFQNAYDMNWSGFDLNDLPVVEVVADEEFCSKKCRTLAAYDDLKSTLFVKASVLPINSARTESIIMHELVHHIQERMGAFEAVDESSSEICTRQVRREIQAYDIQNLYLMSKGYTEGVPSPFNARFCPRK
jgi:hypothetical protein